MRLLKIAFIFMITLGTVVSAAAQNWNWGSGIRGEGPMVKETLRVGDFQAFTLAFSGNVYVRQGSRQSVEVEAQKNIIDNIKTDVSDGHWKIRFDQPVRKYDGIKIYITVPTLTEANVSGSGDIIGEGIFTGLQEFKTQVSGSGDVSMELEAQSITTRISGSGDVKLGGSANRLDIQTSGSGDVYAENLKVTDCTIRISGAGDCRVHATGSLDVRVSGSGDVRYKGSPKVQAKVSGSGNVRTL